MVTKKETKNGIEICTIDSTNIKKTFYQVETEELIIEFTKGGKYSYKPVNLTLYDNFINAPSQGTFFTKNIRNNPKIKTNKA
jgi:hypothetical protein